MMKKKYTLVFLVAFAAFIGFYAMKVMMDGKKQQQNDFLAHKYAKHFVRDHSYRVGPSGAKVILIEFMDPECESCRAMHSEVKNIIKSFAPNLQLVIRYAPFHRNSKNAIRILEAARYQNKYEEVLDLLFHYQPIWGDHHNPKPELIWNYLPNIVGLNVDQLRIDMNSPGIEDIINQDIADGKKLNVQATPTFYVNGRPLLRFGASYLRELIEEELSK